MTHQATSFLSEIKRKKYNKWIIHPHPIIKTQANSMSYRVASLYPSLLISLLHANWGELSLTLTWIYMLVLLVLEFTCILSKKKKSLEAIWNHGSLTFPSLFQSDNSLPFSNQITEQWDHSWALNYKMSF